ncbi:MAG: hypothetical protein SWJ54_10810, partial [Cyanobacteriota bacterium]|nr:hypothetical protein [Cyanobacteriota bacterium]
LRQFWSLVETTQASLIVSLDDTDLVQMLLKQLQTQSTIKYSDFDVINDYLNSKLTLIRDLAESRIAGGH